MSRAPPTDLPAPIALPASAALTGARNANINISSSSSNPPVGVLRPTTAAPRVAQSAPPTPNVAPVSTHDTSEFIFLDRERFETLRESDFADDSGRSAKSDHPAPRNIIDIIASMRTRGRLPVLPAYNDIATSERAALPTSSSTTTTSTSDSCAVDVLCGDSVARGIPEALEEAMFSNFRSFDLPISAATVRSTIAAAVSPDGHTIATTHGDHTVKVSQFIDGQPVRVFRGHPRTPWSVKYHHCNSDILASGCLGFHVCVWSISQDCLLNRLELHNSVISLAFQPQGPYLAVATGPELYLWDWATKATPAIEPRSGNFIRSSSTKPRRKETVDCSTASSSSGSGSGTGRGVGMNKSASSTSTSTSASSGEQRGDTHFTDVACMKIVAHTRNMRAVVFHPFGDVLFVAAPDSPALLGNGDANVVVGCRLYCVSMDALRCELVDAQGIGAADEDEDDNSAQAEENEENHISVADAASESPLSRGNSTSSSSNAAASAAPPTSTSASTTRPTASASTVGAAPSNTGTSTPPSAPTRRTARNLLRREIQPLAPLTSRLTYAEQRARILSDDDDRLLERLDTMACAVPQIHLYSDGGMDISRDGRYLLVCAHMYEPRALGGEVATEVSELQRDLIDMYREDRFICVDPSVQHTEQHSSIVDDVIERMGALSTSDPVAGGIDIGVDVSLEGDNEAISISTTTTTTSSSNTTPTDVATVSSPPDSIRIRMVSDMDNNGSGEARHLPPALFLDPNSLALATGPGAFDWSAFNQAFTQQPHLALLRLDFDNMRCRKGEKEAIGSTSTSIYNNQDIDIPTRSEQSSSKEIAVRSESTDNSNRVLTSEALSCSMHITSLNCQSRNSTNNRIGKNYYDISISLVNYRTIPDALTTAITCLKLSPTSRFAMLGYGVRTRGVVVEHPFEHAALEVVSLAADGPMHMPMAAMVCDEVDEVNIAQFHPLPGAGWVYGTKRGRVTIFVKGEPTADINSTSSGNTTSSSNSSSGGGIRGAVPSWPPVGTE